MKKTVIITSLLFSLFSCEAPSTKDEKQTTEENKQTEQKQEEKEITSIEIGASLPHPNDKMLDVSETHLSFNDISKQNGLLIVFSCNTCPFVVGRGSETEGWEGRYNSIYDICEENKVGMVLVNSNSAKRTAENQDDSFENMQKRAQEKAYKMHYVLDSCNHIADDFGAKTTPHIFLFDSTKSLVYKGAIDDNVDNALEVKEKWLENALNNLVQGSEITPNTTKNIGCSIKREKTK